MNCVAAKLFLFTLGGLGDRSLTRVGYCVCPFTAGVLVVRRR